MAKITSIEIHNFGQEYQYTEEVTRDWILTNYLCMNCGQKGIFEAQDSEVDYGGGNRHKCALCGFEFYGYGSNVEVEANRDTQNKLKELLDAS